jgi:hypothetical protein
VNNKMMNKRIEKRGKGTNDQEKKQMNKNKCNLALFIYEPQGFSLKKIHHTGKG